MAMPEHPAGRGKGTEFMILLIAALEPSAFEIFASMENDENSDSDQFSDDDFYNELADDFDLVELNEERAELADVVHRQIKEDDEMVSPHRNETDGNQYFQCVRNRSRQQRP